MEQKTSPALKPISEKPANIYAAIKTTLTPEWLLIGSLALLKLLIHFLTNTNYELHRDAFLYLSLADHPDWGYFSVPPAIAVVANITQFLFGDSVFSIRLFPALIGATSVVLIGAMVKEMGGKFWAILLACSAFILSPAFLRSNTLCQPVSFNQFFWLLTAFFILKLVKNREPRYWLYLGITWGLAFLNKYSIVFIAAGFVVALLLTPERKLIFSKYAAAGAAIGFLMILPNLIWQHQHQWLVLNHMAELQRTQLVNVDIGGFIAMQFLMNVHAVFIWLFGLVFLIFLRDGRRFRVLGLAFLAVFLLLILLRGKPYYTLGAYPMLFAAGGVAIERYFSGRLRLLGPVILIMMALGVAPVIPFSLPVLSHDKMAAYAEVMKDYGLKGALIWEDGKLHKLPQDYADMIGWEEIAGIVINTYETLGSEEKSGCYIYAENYGLAGAIKYHDKANQLPEPFSFSDNFLLWAPDSAEIRTLIYVDDDLSEDISSNFAQVTLIGELTNEYARENGTKVFLCQQPSENFSAGYREKIARLKRRFR